MTLCRFIAPKWLATQDPTKRPIEGLFTSDQILAYNEQGYNAYYLPNRPKQYIKGITVDGSMIDQFDWVFVDMDLKDGTYPTKDAFLERLTEFSVMPTKVVDSGNGIHVYWRVTDLDVMSYLRLQRRLLRHLKTDEAVAQIFQLMRVPETINTKKQDNYVLCETIVETDANYTCEELDKALPPISVEDEKYCQDHYNRTHKIDTGIEAISDTIPPKFGELLKSSAEAKEIWIGNTDDRSKNDYRLGHIMLASGFTKEEASSVLVNSAKAMSRAPTHRFNYAKNIVDKIWTYEASTPEERIENVSPTVLDLLSRGDDAIKGERFPCHTLIDDTVHGFRLGQVIGIVGGSGVGKTTLTLNAFLWFAERNPDFHHFFFSLEQPAGEVASRIRTICGQNTSLFEHIHIASNYTDNGEFRELSLTKIEEQILRFKEETGFKVGAIVIDHIGVLSKSDKNGENDGLIGLCRQMKPVAQRTNTLMMMLSQAPREKAGIGDLELDKSCAYGTVFFESFCDYLLCLWQPLKRAYAQGAPTIMAFKFAKIRHKKQGHDKIQEDVCYQLFFDPSTERLREVTQAEESAIKFHLNVSTNLRKADKKTDLVTYQSRRVEEVVDEATAKRH